MIATDFLPKTGKNQRKGLCVKWPGGIWLLILPGWRWPGRMLPRLRGWRLARGLRGLAGLFAGMLAAARAACWCPGGAGCLLLPGASRST